MQTMYDTYGDIAEFRIVYINEAHASDSSWPVEYAEEKGITEHDDYGERCSTADMLLADKSITIPTVIDGMDNAVNEAYSASPDRAFIVRTDGKLALASGRGPWGFAPAIDDAKAWLAMFKETGAEPAIQIVEAQELFSFETEDSALEPVLGKWDIWIQFKNREIEASLTIGFVDGVLAGEWIGMGNSSALENLSFEGNTLSFTRSMGEGRKVSFEGTVESNKIDGVSKAPFGDLKTTGTRLSGT
jgi:hypothetical protein